MASRRPALRAASASAVALVCLMLACFSCGAARAQADSAEHAVKATYLYKFAPFIDWTGEAFATSSSPLILCVAGDDPFGGILDRAVRAQSTFQRPIEVRRIATVSRASGCHIAYLAGSAAQPVVQGLAQIRGSPVLTVTDAARDPGAKGIIHFVISEGRVRFEIDAHAAAESGILISSKLLSLALSVRGRT